MPTLIINPLNVSTAKQTIDQLDFLDVRFREDIADDVWTPTEIAQGPSLAD